MSIKGQIIAKKFCAAVKIVAKQSTTSSHDLDSGADFNLVTVRRFINSFQESSLTFDLNL